MSSHPCVRASSRVLTLVVCVALLLTAHAVATAQTVRKVQNTFVLEEGLTYRVSPPLRPDPAQPQAIVDAASLEAEMEAQFGVAPEELTLQVVWVAPGFNEYIYCYPASGPGIPGFPDCTFRTDDLTWSGVNRDAITLHYESPPLAGGSAALVWYGEEVGPRHYGNLYMGSQLKSLPWDDMPADAATVRNEINADAGANVVISVSKWLPNPGAWITYAGISPANNFAFVPGEAALIQMNGDLAEPVGACCTGVACAILSETECDAAGGVYQGAGVPCLATTCGQPSACTDLPPALPCTAGNCPGACQDCGGAVEFSDPVYLFSGEFHYSEVDLEIPGRGFDFKWARKYRSRTGSSAGIGSAWDTGYDIYLLPITIGTPSEVPALAWDDKTTFSWSPPQNPGGTIGDLRYCTLRSTDPGDFLDPGKASVIADDQAGLSTTDTDPIAPGELFNYLVRAKSGLRAGTLGYRPDGEERAGLDCGVTGPDLYLDDGNGRRDLYNLQGDGTWQHPETFQVITKNPDSTYTLTFADGGTWRFAEFDGSIGQGRLIGIGDRNGNAQGFGYDAYDRLTSVVDTLGNTIVLAYNVDGFLESVTDHTGREVRYEYYDGVEPGGSWGDLKSVTSPEVSGTSTGNDFPLGKTRVYTYSTGHADERLNHNLLTITDPKGQVYLTNEYSPETDPDALEFDRVVRQTWGHPGEVLDYAYEPLTPEPANNGSVLVTIVNDRVGNVKEFYFDAANRNVMLREYTGRAAPNLPTTLVDNRPGAALRPFDPPWFETRWEYNDASRPTRIIFPRQNEQTFLYDETNPDRRAQGNLLERCRVAGPIPSDQPVICETFEYDDGGGGCCGTNFITRHVDGRGNETLHDYDAAGNRIHTQHRIPSIVEDFEYNGFGQRTARDFPADNFGVRRRDEYDYYGGGHQEGRLQEIRRDVANLNLTTSYEYDDVGNAVRVVDPNGADSLYEFNQLNQVVRELSREVEPGGIRYEKALYYDANDNLVRIDRQNLDEDGIPRPDEWVTTVMEYEILNNLVAICTEVDGIPGATPPGPLDQPLCGGFPNVATTLFEYDANRNRTLTMFGEAAAGRQLENTVRTTYDERDLVFESIRAEFHPEQSTTRYDYDENRNARTIHKGLESVPRSYYYDYDGYDRLFLASDPMGNDVFYEYDERHNLVHEVVFGELLDLPGPGGNVTLADSSYGYDAMDRRTLSEVGHFHPLGGFPVGDGIATTIYDYDGISRAVAVHDDNLDTTQFEYDSAHRLAAVIDPAGNRTDYFYDQNSNLISLIEINESDLGNPAEIYSTNYTYDGLDRRIRTDNNIGDVERFRYDSRSNLTWYEDAQRLSPVDPGNVTTYTYDGLDRRIRTTRELTDDGSGSGVWVGEIFTIQEWDDTSRLVVRVDDNGNATQYEYDPLNRLVNIDYADGTERVYEYDAHDNVVLRADANGTVVQPTYDLLDRLTGRTIAPGPGIIGTTTESHDYDGMSRLVRAQNADATVERTYDSMSNLVTETLNGQTVQFDYDGVGNKLLTQYPGGRTIERFYDSLRRVEAINEPMVSVIADYSYVGPVRVERRNYVNATSTDYSYDGLGRLIGTDTSGPGGALDQRQFDWDPMSNKTLHLDARPSGPGTQIDYVYDSVYRMVGSDRLFSPSGPQTIDYEYDGVGNRLNVFGSVDAGSYVLDPTLPDPGDYQMNQYTQTPFDDREYDANGNQVSADDPAPGTRSYAYDYQDRLLEFADPATGFVYAYSYDPLGRRIGRHLVFGGPPQSTLFFYDGLRVIEEQDGGGVTQATYVHGGYIDELLQMERFGQTFYYHQDDLYSTTAVSDLVGNAVERYEYDDFGTPRFFNASMSPLPFSLIENPYLFTGRRWDTESELYFYRTRYMDPRAGRFITHDSIGPWGDPDNLGSALAYVGNNPASRLDPSGRAQETGPYGNSMSNDEFAGMVEAPPNLGIGPAYVSPGIVPTEYDGASYSNTQRFNAQNDSYQLYGIQRFNAQNDSYQRNNVQRFNPVNDSFLGASMSPGVFPREFTGNTRSNSQRFNPVNDSFVAASMSPGVVPTEFWGNSRSETRRFNPVNDSFLGVNNIQRFNPINDSFQVRNIQRFNPINDSYQLYSAPRSTATNDLGDVRVIPRFNPQNDSYLLYRAPGGTTSRWNSMAGSTRCGGAWEPPLPTTCSYDGIPFRDELLPP